ncbi:endo-1,4-beta-xylanase [Rathayibacter sp. YIM 133350]|uniref:GH39 family glycosyl hydrolase n=1 Tax=Rathayibacter sp. YIM 133350 TaxID=3131992 RepID=UPI00307DCA93
MTRSTVSAMRARGLRALAASAVAVLAISIAPAGFAQADPHDPPPPFSETDPVLPSPEAAALASQPETEPAAEPPLNDDGAPLLEDPAAPGDAKVWAQPAPGVGAEAVTDTFSDASAWTITSGTGTVTTATAADGSQDAVRLGYDLSGGDVRMGTADTPVPIPSQAYTRVSVRALGDGTYNTLYVRLKDAAGEQFTYRLGNINSKTWTTLSADLTAKPSLDELGDKDGILDAPIIVTDFRVVRNGSASKTGSVTFDTLSFTTDGWSSPASSQRRFSPGNGGSTTLSFTAGAPGDWALVVRDLAGGHSRTFTGTADAAGPVSISWNGKTADNVAMAGNIEGDLSHDDSPDGSLESTRVTSASPYLTGASVRPPNANQASFAGINTFLTSTDDAAKVDSETKLLEDARIRYARDEFEWNRIEPRDDNFDWWKFDQAVNLAYARNVEFIGKLVYSAAWASSAPAGTPTNQIKYYPPRNLADYVDYVTAVVSRYKDRVKVWEVWNEPNFDDYWKPAPDAAAYAKMLKVTYAAIKKVDPTSTVLAPATAGYDAAFMNTLSANGADNSYDGLSIHAYVRGTPEANIFSTWVSAAKAYLALHHPGGSLWMTELSWSSCTDCEGSNSEQEQAIYLARAYAIAAAAGFKAITWWSLLEFGTSPSRLDNYGLVTADGRQKPGYLALKNLGTAAAETTVEGELPPTDADSGEFSDVFRLSAYALQRIGLGDVARHLVHLVRGGARFDYDVSNGKGDEFNTIVSVPGEPKAISVLVSGDVSANSLFMRFTDRTGEYFEAKIGNLDQTDLARKTFYFDSNMSNYSHGGGNNNNVIDYPITIRRLTVYRGLLGINTGSFTTTDFVAHYGNVLRGIKYDGKGFDISGPYSVARQIVDVPVGTATKATLGPVSGPTLPVKNGKAAVDVGPQTEYVRH